MDTELTPNETTIKEIEEVERRHFRKQVKSALRKGALVAVPVAVVAFIVGKTRSVPKES